MTSQERALMTGAAGQRRIVRDILAAWHWLEAHPEQASPAYIASLYPDPDGPRCSRWLGDDTGVTRC